MISAALMCMALNVYHESRSEDLRGQVAVANVTLNRVADSKWPNDVCSVVRLSMRQYLERRDPG